MKRRIQPRISTFVGLALLTVAVLLVAAPARGAKAPAGKTYFVISVGLSTEAPEAYEPDAGCLRFTRTEMCESGGNCGSWWPTEDPERSPKQSPLGFRFELTDDETGLLLVVEGAGRIDWRGPKSSIAGVGHAEDPVSGAKINFAIAGRAVGPARCAELAQQLSNR